MERGMKRNLAMLLALGGLGGLGMNDHEEDGFSPCGFLGMGLEGLDRLKGHLGLGSAPLKSADLISAEATIVGKEAEISQLRECVTVLSSLLDETKKEHQREVQQMREEHQQSMQQMRELISGLRGQLTELREANQELQTRDSATNLLKAVRTLLEERTANVGPTTKRSVLFGILEEVKLQLASTPE